MTLSSTLETRGLRSKKAARRQSNTDPQPRRVGQIADRRSSDSGLTQGIFEAAEPAGDQGGA
jgi:hypothetical protein